MSPPRSILPWHSEVSQPKKSQKILCLDPLMECLRPSLTVSSGTNRELFHQYGPPLALKSDNGSVFFADVMREVMAEQTVAHLFSPAGRTSYNGDANRAAVHR